MEFIGPFTYTAVRFTLGTLVLVPFYLVRRRKNERLNGSIEIKTVSDQVCGETKQERKRLILYQIILGLLLFGGISFQQYGLLFTTAGNAGFITGFYVVLVPVAGLFIGHKNHWSLWTGVVLAITGLFFLSVTSTFQVRHGDLLVAVCAVFWTFHVLLVGHIAPKCDPVKIAIIQFAICSVLSFIVAFLFESIDLALIQKAAIPILYGGILSVGIAYTLQIVAQQHAHPSYASIILSMESLFAVLGGWLILDEHFSLRSLLGCLLMLAGMIVVQVKEMNSAK
ncbi:MAG: DMT family transporter, partial [Bacteroidota bacterium]